jgi:hypothetical protein
MDDPRMRSYMGKNLSGTEVTLTGLVGRPELNGTKAVMLNWHEASVRWMIKLPSGESLRLKHENVCFPTGEEHEMAEARKKGVEEARQAVVEASLRTPPAADAKAPPGWAEGEKRRAEARKAEGAQREAERKAKAQADAEAAAAAAAEEKAAEEAEAAAAAARKAAREREVAKERAAQRTVLSDPVGWLRALVAFVLVWLCSLLGVGRSTKEGKKAR